LQDEAFKELLLELPDLNFRLLAMLDPAASVVAPQPAFKRQKLFLSDEEDGGDDEDGGEDASDRLIRHYRYGPGHTLG
jgi:hypothetical protein